MMVSTRGVKVRFKEGERVLCYEPDPTKAKVLYDSKVLQVVDNKDGRGRKQLEYLIHFQGWNASWDRCVDEDQVLRDTEENRELQMRLIENAHIKVKEKKKKRRLSDTIREIVLEREKQKKDNSGSETASQESGNTDNNDEDDNTSLLSDVDSRTDSISSRGGSHCDTGPPPPPPLPHITEPPSTGVECHSPSTGVQCHTPSTAGQCHTPSTGAPCQPHGTGSPCAASLHNIGTCTAVEEEDYLREFPIEIPVTLKTVLERDHSLVKEDNKLLQLPHLPSALSVLENYVRFFATRYLARTSERRRNETKLKDKSYLTLDLCKEVMDGVRVCFDFHCSSHLLYTEEQQQAAQLATAPPPVLYCNGHRVDANANGKGAEKNKSTDDNLKSSAGSDGSSSGGRRLTRSGVVRPKDSPVHVQSAAASNSESGRSTPVTDSTVSRQHATPHAMEGGHLALLGHLSQDLEQWTLLPAAHRMSGTATLLYGPLHLLRLFVKLPEILYRMNFPPEKRKIILKHIHLFIEYLDVHRQDLFSESHYVSSRDWVASPATTG